MTLIHRYLALAVAALVLGVGLWTARPRLRPQLQSNELQIQAVVQPAHSDLKAFSPDALWELVISVTGRPGQRPSGPYLIYPFPSPGYRLVGWDYLQGWNTEGGSMTTVLPPGFGNIGWQGSTWSATLKALRDAGFPLGDLKPDVSYPWGFTYTGTNFPARIRFHLQGVGEPGPVAVVLVPVPNRDGQQPQWTRFMYAEVVPAKSQ